jgi:hypothetical protein
MGTSALAAWAWLFRPRRMPWDDRLGARVRVLLRRYGLPWGRLVLADGDNKRSKSAITLAHLYQLRAQDRGGYVWGHSLVLRLVVTPDLTLPGGFTCHQPAPELSAWETQEKALTKQEVPATQRPPQPPPKPPSPSKPALARRL